MSESDLRQDLARLEANLENMTKEFAAFRADHQEILEAWRAAEGFFRFLKWFLSLAATAAALWAAITQIKWH